VSVIPAALAQAVSPVTARVSRHKTPLSVILVVIILAAVAGTWYAGVEHIPVTSGICYALGVVTTSGSSVTAGTGGTARLITALSQLLLIPLGGAVFSMVTSRITSDHVRHELNSHHVSLHQKLDELLRHKGIPAGTSGKEAASGSAGTGGGEASLHPAGGPGADGTAGRA
jgi:hypothetical protein